MSPAVESEANIRKRVGKACDRCRMKKSKCDGNSPCSRCTADGSPSCSFGERKRSHRVCPDGYVDWLEQQQVQLVMGCQELYRRLLAHDAWDGVPLPLAPNGKPSMHHLLEHLGILRSDPTISRHASFDSSSSSMRQKLSLAAAMEAITTCESPDSVSSPNSHDDGSSGMPSGTTSMSSVSHAFSPQLPIPPGQPPANCHRRSSHPPSLPDSISSRSQSTSTPHSEASSPRKRARPNLYLSSAGFTASIQNPYFHASPVSDTSTATGPPASSFRPSNRDSADMSIASHVAHYQRRASHAIPTPLITGSLFVEPAWNRESIATATATRAVAVMGMGVELDPACWDDDGVSTMDFLTSDEEFRYTNTFGPFDFAGLGLGEGGGLGGVGGGARGRGGSNAAGERVGGALGEGRGGGGAVGATWAAMAGFSEFDYAEYLDPGAFAGGEEVCLVIEEGKEKEDEEEAF